MRPCKTFLTVSLILLLAASAAAQEALERALVDELERSMAELRLEELERPYFLAYRVDDVRTASASASLGSLLGSGENRRRTLYVELRVGGYDFDNTNFLSGPSFGGSPFAFRGSVSLPLEDDYREIRRQVWLATDGAYKNALEDLARKRSALETKTRTEELPDLHRAEPHELRGDEPVPEPDPKDGEDLVVELSARLLPFGEIWTSEARFQASAVSTFYTNSEGTTYTRVLSDAAVEVMAATQAEDGMWLEDSVASYGREPGDLAAAAVLGERVAAMGERLTELRRAELLDRYNGPVLFEAEAAAELFAQAFVPKLLASRRPVTGDERLAMMLARDRGESFEDRISARVLPRFLSAVDDPTARELDGEKLFGGYPVDDEGTLAGPTSLVERGYLKTLLADRTPVSDVASSTGNARAGAVTPSNLLFRVERGGMTAEELREELLTLVADRGAEFGVYVRRVANPDRSARDQGPRGFSSFGSGPGGPGTALVAAYKVYPDGREVLLRNVEISGLTAQSFKEIVAASEASRVVHRPFRPPRSNPFRPPSPQIPLIALATPAVLFEELTLKKPSLEIPQLPSVPRPGTSVSSRGGAPFGRIHVD